MRQGLLRGAAVLLTAALAAAGAIPAAAAAPTATCTLDLRLPAKAAISSGSVPLTVGVTNPVACISIAKLELVRQDSPAVLSSSTMLSEYSDDYARGEFTWDASFRGGAVPGTYTARAQPGWTAYGPWLPDGVDYEDALLDVRSTTIDLRLASAAAIKAARTAAGVRVSGTVTRYEPVDDETVGWSGATVDVQRRDGDVWTTVSTVTTDRGGAFSATIADDSGASWRAVARESSTVWSATSGAANVAARQVLPAKVVSPKAVRSGGKVTVTGYAETSVGTGYARTSGVAATLQRASGSTWVDVGTATSTSGGLLSATVTTSKAVRLRWRVAATPRHHAAVSASLSVARAPVPASPTKVTLTAKRSGDTMTATGKVSRVTGSSSTGASGVKVRLQKRSGSSWTTVRTVTSGKGGRLSASYTSTSKVSLRWYVPATKTLKSSTSATRTVAARPVTTVSISHSSERDRISGVVRVPKGSGTAVAKGIAVRLERKVGGKWRTVATARTDARGKVSVRTPDVQGLASFRWYVPATRGSKATTSSVLDILGFTLFG